MEFGHQRLNPIEHPNGVHFPLWFGSLETLTGQLLGSQPGVRSGFFPGISKLDTMNFVVWNAQLPQMSRQ